MKRALLLPLLFAATLHAQQDLREYSPAAQQSIRTGLANGTIHFEAGPHGGEYIANQVVNVNTATLVQLCYLPGIGVKVAAAIVAGRPYRAVDALADVKGIKARRLMAIRPYVTLTGGTTATEKIHATKKAGAK